MNTFHFPKNFLWGTATSAHQIEGNNNNCDWWQWEQSKDYEKCDREYPLDPSDIACDSYNRYEEDFDICRELNNNAVRFSIEWARIEPKEDEFSEMEIEHYRKVLMAAKARGLKTFVTLHHFTNPIWFSDKGGWANHNAPKYFAKYAKKCAEEFGDLIDVFLTINEPQVYALQSYTNGTWPPNKKSFLSSLIVQINMIRAHRASYDSIKSIDENCKVGIVKNIAWYLTDSHIVDKIAVKIMNFVGRDFILRPLKNKMDVLGLNFYFTTYIKNLKRNNPDDVMSDLGWWVGPRGLEDVLVYLKKYNIPIYVTENGCADSKDRIRKQLIQDMLISCANAIEKGVDLRGYFHWSLLDNYEWHHGFWPRFGLIEIDRENNLERKPRESAKYYAQICKSNSLELSKPSLQE